MDLRAPLPDAERLSGKSNTNTLKHEGITKSLLCRMFVSSQMMGLGSESRFTGLILFHRYIRQFHHLMEVQKQGVGKQEQRQDAISEIKQIRQHLGKVAAACLFLGCKMSEEPRRIRDVINLSSVLGFTSSSSSLEIDNETSQEELVRIEESTEPPPLDNEYWATKDEIVSTEQLVLRMLQFDALVCHPHRCVLIVMDTLGFGTGMNEGASTNNNTFLTPEQSDSIIQNAWRFINESSVDPMGEALVYPVTVLACASIQVAADGIHLNLIDAQAKRDSRRYQIELPKFWWRALDVNTCDVNAAMSSLRKIIHLSDT